MKKKLILLIEILIVLFAINQLTCNPIKEDDSIEFALFVENNQKGAVIYNEHLKKNIQADLNQDGLESITEQNPKKGDMLLLFSTGPHIKDKIYKVKIIKNKAFYEDFFKNK